MGAYTSVYHGELTCWEKIRELSSLRMTGTPQPHYSKLRKLFIESMIPFFKGWRNSGCKIVPGRVGPMNVAVPGLDFREGATLLSLVGWKEYLNTLSLIRPMVRNFYRKIVNHYPWTRYQLDLNWIFDACVDALGNRRADDFFRDLEADLMRDDVTCPDGKSLRSVLAKYLDEREHSYYLPLALDNAIERFDDWERKNPGARPAAREETVGELYRLYRLRRYPEIVRYHLYRSTYFVGADAEVTRAFDALLKAMGRDLARPAEQLVELSDLQAALTTDEDRAVFSRMVFPRLPARQKLDILKIGESDRGHVVIQSHVTDRHDVVYNFREAVEPGEIGQLYRHFIKEKYPKTISEQDRYFVVTDGNRRVIGGICYKLLENRSVLLDGVVVGAPLKGRGIGKAMVEDFLTRMENYGVRLVKTHFFLSGFYKKLGFEVDRRWGTLVMPLTSEASAEEEV